MFERLSLFLRFGCGLLCLSNICLLCLTFEGAFVWTYSTIISFTGLLCMLWLPYFYRTKLLRVDCLGSEIILAFLYFSWSDIFWFTEYVGDRGYREMLAVFKALSASLLLRL